MRESIRNWIAVLLIVALVLMALISGCAGDGRVATPCSRQQLLRPSTVDAALSSSLRQARLHNTQVLYPFQSHQHEKTSIHRTQAQLALRTRAARRNRPLLGDLAGLRRNDNAAGRQRGHRASEATPAETRSTCAASDGSVILPYLLAHSQMETTATASAYTPGPWLLIDDCYSIYPGIDAEGQNIVLNGDLGEYCGVRGDSRSEALANACLIVAAPDLREASQRLYDAIQRYLIDIPDRELPADLVEAFDAMEAAWHKAAGTTPEQP